MHRNSIFISIVLFLSHMCYLAKYQEFKELSSGNMTGQVAGHIAVILI